MREPGAAGAHAAQLRWGTEAAEAGPASGTRRALKPPLAQPLPATLLQGRLQFKPEIRGPRLQGRRGVTEVARNRTLVSWPLGHCLSPHQHQTW